MSTLTSRFWKKVNKSAANGCWEWTATPQAFGYGRIGTRDEQGAHCMELAHRVSWKMHHGPIPDGLCVLHRCDNPKCVNPAHLFLGTRGENIADMVAKKRQAVGERKRSAKLTEAAIAKIRELAQAGIMQSQIAKEFAVSRSLVCMVVSSKRWGHVR